MELLIYIGLFMLGASLASFAVAQVWRYRAQQLIEEDQAGEKVNQKELKKLLPLVGKKIEQDRSRCLDCHHQLAWYDLLPVLSWIILRGKCRYCRKSIGKIEFIAEVVLGIVFVLSFIFWPSLLDNPLELCQFGLWLVGLTALTVNFVYDLRWSLLLSKYNWLLVAAGLLYAAISVAQSADWASTLWSAIGAVMILGGLYAALWLISRGRWVGEGDIYLGSGLALFLLDWKVAFVALFAANLVGTAAILPAMISGKIKRGSHVPFGPLLIVGGLIAWFVGPMIVNWYLSLVFLT